MCDAVQHAHQHGVLHRDLKPSNVVVDGSGRPRVLDFGLAKLATRSGTASASGEFVGTPAYAAPEQWRGGDVDARADVYSLGAILFEMLTGRRVHEGDALEVLARAEESEPPRPSALLRAIPRELDAIVLQALARKRAARYQSVDALSGDVRRFLAGEAVLAHPPGAWYHLRKLVARNRLATGLFAALLFATLLYALAVTRQARRLAEERNRAVAASEAESRARAAAEAEGRRADDARQRAEEEERRTREALAETERERQRARSEQAKAEAAKKFLVEDVIGAADPLVLGHEPTLIEILTAAAPKVAERFGGSPEVELDVRTMLSDSFRALGRYSDAEAEMRRAIELLQARPEASPADLGWAEDRLAKILFKNGGRPETEAVLKAAIAHFEKSEPLDARGLGSTLNSLACLYVLEARSGEAIPLLERVLEVDPATGVPRLTTMSNLGAALMKSQRFDEARAILEDTLEQSEAQGIESVELLFANLGGLYEALGDAARAEAYYRRGIEVERRIFGSAHERLAIPMFGLSRVLGERGEYAEAEDLARRSLEIQRVSAPRSRECALFGNWRAYMLLQMGDLVRAEAAYVEALSFCSDGPDGVDWLTCAENLGVVLTRNWKLDEAEELLVEVAEGWRRRNGSRMPEFADVLINLGDVYRQRGELAEAAGLFEEAVEILTPLPAKRAALRKVLELHADVLRRQGETERAAEIDRRVNELR